MSETTTRGYCIERTFSFIESYFDPETITRAFERTVTAETRSLRSELKPAVWYPRKHLESLNRAIVAASGDKDRAYEALVKCGIFMSAEATNTYLRVLMKLLTPGLFAKKLPTFWDRDFRGGRITTDPSKIEQNELSIALTDVEGFDHTGIVSIGFMTFVLEAMGKKDIQIEQKGWSLETPGPERYDMKVRWT